MALYPLKSINQLESTFLGLCEYDLFVSKELYDRYYEAIITKTMDLDAIDEAEFYLEKSA